MSTKRTIRVSINVILYKDDKVVVSTTKQLKSQVMQVLQGVPAVEWNKGYVRVWYNRKKDFYNHAYFSTVEALKHHLSAEDMLDQSVLEAFCT